VLGDHLAKLPCSNLTAPRSLYSQPKLCPTLQLAGRNFPRAGSCAAASPKEPAVSPEACNCSRTTLPQFWPGQSSSVSSILGAESFNRGLWPSSEWLQLLEVAYFLVKANPCVAQGGNRTGGCISQSSWFADLCISLAPSMRR
jgi:hypothetical protein